MQYTKTDLDGEAPLESGLFLLRPVGVEGVDEGTHLGPSPVSGIFAGCC